MGDLGIVTEQTNQTGDSRLRLLEEWLAPSLVFFFALALTLIGWRREEADELDHAQIRLEHAAENVVFEALQSLSSVEGLMRAGYGIYASHAETLSSGAYRQFVTSLDIDKHFPGIDGMGIVLPVPHAELPVLAAKLKARDPTINIRPSHSGQEHYVTVLTEPMERTKGAIGFDHAASKERREALDRARDKGIPVLTPKLTLVTRDGAETGLLYYLPVYKLGLPLGSVEERRAAFSAWVIVGFFVDKLLDGILDEAGDIDVDIYDGLNKDKSLLLFDSNPPNLQRSSLFVHTKAVHVGGRDWTFNFSSTPQFETDNQSGRGFLILAGGLAITLLLGLATYLLASSRGKARREARGMTEALRDERNFIAAVLDAQTTMTLVLDREGVIRRVNHAAMTITGLPAASLIGTALIDLAADALGRTALAAAFDRLNFGSLEDGCESAIASARSGIHHMRWSFVRLGANEASGLIIATGIDITDSKQVEDALRLERSLFVGGPVVVFRWLDQPGWPMAYVSPNVSQFGIPSGELLSGRAAYASLIHPQDLARVVDEVRRHVAAGAASFEQEYRLIRTDGVELWVYDYTVIERRINGEVESFLGYVIDITSRKRAEESRRLSEARFGTIITTTSEGYWEIDQDNLTVEVNPALCRILGHDEAELMGRHPREFAGPGQESIFDNSLSDLKQPQRRYDIWLKRKSGELVFCRFNATSLFDNRDRKTGSFALVTDITAEQQAHEHLRKEEARLRSIIETLPVAILLTRPNGQVLHVNASGLELFRARNPDQPLGTAEDYYVTPSDRGKFLEVLRSLGRVDHFETQLKRFDGSSFWTFLSARMFSYEDDPALLVACVDISERKNTELRLAELTQELQRSNAELEQFAYVASHDLQEPLRMVASYVQLIERRYADKLDGDGLEFISFAVDGAKRMQAMINDLLDYSRVSRKGRPFEPLDTRRPLDEALVNLSGHIQETGAKVEIGDLPQIMGDESQIVRLFQNLLGNALKYRSPDRAPVIKVEAERKGGHWQFMVRDNGIGVVPEFHERIFVLFQRLHSRKEYPGTGIGLSLCRKIVERHGGRIWVVSIKEQAGSSFFFTIPCNE
jgi:PAS domain S-box-containing protein